MTGRELIRLQATLHGLARAEGQERAEALLTRVGLDHAADRRVGTYSGGMKRRLDLASALVHQATSPLPRRADNRPRPDQPQGDLGGGAGAERRRRDDFLTTQYLEEADRWPTAWESSRAGSGRRGHADRAEGRDRHAPMWRSPSATVRWNAREGVVAPLGKPLPSRDGLLLLELQGGATGVAPVVRALDEAGLAVESLDLVEPTLDDVFVAKTGRHLEGDDDVAAPEIEPAPAGT